MAVDVRRGRFMYFPTEGATAEEADGRVYGLACHVRRGDPSTPSNRLVVRADVKGCTRGAFDVATAWVVGLLQTGVLATAGLETQAVTQRRLWQVHRPRSHSPNIGCVFSLLGRGCRVMCGRPGRRSWLK